MTTGCIGDLPHIDDGVDAFGCNDIVVNSCGVTRQGASLDVTEEIRDLMHGHCRTNGTGLVEPAIERLQAAR